MIVEIKAIDEWGYIKWQVSSKKKTKNVFPLTFILIKGEHIRVYPVKRINSVYDRGHTSNVITTDYMMELNTQIGVYAVSLFDYMKDNPKVKVKVELTEDQMV